MVAKTSSSSLPSWLDADKMALIIRALMALAIWWSGSQAVTGASEVAAQGVANSTPQDMAPVGGNAFITLVASVIFAKPNKLAEWISDKAGIGGVTTATQFSQILLMHKNWRVASSSDVKQRYKDTAQALLRDMFDETDPDNIVP